MTATMAHSVCWVYYGSFCRVLSVMELAYYEKIHLQLMLLTQDQLPHLIGGLPVDCFFWGREGIVYWGRAWALSKFFVGWLLSVNLRAEIHFEHTLWLSLSPLSLRQIVCFYFWWDRALGTEHKLQLGYFWLCPGSNDKITLDFLEGRWSPLPLLPPRGFLLRLRQNRECDSSSYYASKGNPSLHEASSWI